MPLEARGQRLDQHLSTTFPDLTRSRIQSLIDGGLVRIEGRAPKASLRLRGGEQVELQVPAPVPALPAAQELPIRILYEDRDLVVVDKAPGMVVHPAVGHAEGTLVNALLYQVKDLSGIGGELRPGVVHRLDKDTSGCLVVAKNEQALAGLQSAFRTRAVEKTYLALVHGVPRSPEGTLETLYGRHPVHRKRFTGKVKSGKPAATAYRVRVHLSEMGHPILCDALYGGARKAKGAVAAAQDELRRQALHAWKLAFAHPRTGRPLSFEAPLPSDFARALELLGPTALPG